MSRTRTPWFSRILENYELMALSGLTVFWIVLQFVSRLPFLPEGTAISRLAEDVYSFVVPGSLLISLAWLFKIARDQQKLIKSQTTARSFNHIDDLFYDLHRNCIRNREVEHLMVTRIRTETDANYSDYPNVARYYEGVVHRVATDSDFRLTRILGTDNIDKIKPLCEKWLDEVGTHQHQLSLYILDKLIPATQFNVVVAAGTSGVLSAYIVFSPSANQIAGICIENDRAVLESIRNFYESLLKNARPITKENVQKLTQP